MRQIIVPRDIFIDLPTPDGKKQPVKYTFQDFLLDVVVTTPEAGKGYDGARRGEKIKGISHGLGKPGTKVNIDETDFVWLQLAMRTASLIPIFNTAALSFYEAIETAKESPVVVTP